MATFGFNTNCQGEFVIDDNGLRALEPVAFTKATWYKNDRVLELVGPNNTSNVIIINGIRYTSGNNEDVPKKNFDISWSDIDMTETPCLTNLDLKGSDTTVQVKITLDEDCDINSSGKATVCIDGHNENTGLTINSSGMTTVQGGGKIKQLSVHSSGMSNIGGFVVNKKLNINSSGMSNINLSHTSECRVIKNVSGMGSCNLRKV